MSAHGFGGPGQRRAVQFFVLVVVLSLSIAAGSMAVTMGRTAPTTDAFSTPSLTSEERSAMEEMYSPVLSFSTGERTFPVNVEYFIANSRLVGGPRGGSIEHPGPEDLGGPGLAGSYLDDTGGTRGDGGAIVKYERDRGDLTNTVYVRTVEKGGSIVIQYWLFYVFNQGTYNSHEGDWELVQAIIDSSTKAPTSLTLSQHHTGARTAWAGMAVKDMVGSHPVVLVAAGSHANYLSSDPRRSPGDRTDGHGMVLGPPDYRLVSIGPEGGVPYPPWLLFPGSWGETAAMGDLLGTGGPPGPMYRENGALWEGLGWGA
jgi:hypothetical protein